MDKEELFLKEYVALCRKHKLSLQSCGDCASMWIDPFKEDEVLKYEDGWSSISIERKTYVAENDYKYIKETN